MIKLSIIIPVYNVEKYIEKCIISAINQDINTDDYEIIIIDDESPDNSKIIVENIIEKYTNIYLFSQKNKGLGGARNTGISNSKGKFLLFLDSDDYLKPNTLNSILKYAINNSLDILEFGAIGITENGKIVYTKSFNTNNITTGYQYLNNYQYMNSACNKLYSSEFIKKNNLLFKEKLYIEDFEFNTRAFYFAKKVIGINTIISYFVQSENSITRNNSTYKNVKMIDDITKVITLTNNFNQKITKNNNPLTTKVINERIGFLIVTLIYSMIKFKIDIIKVKDILKYLKQIDAYPIKVKINNKQKNIFKLLINNEAIFLIVIKYSNLINIF